MRSRFKVLIGVFLGLSVPTVADDDVVVDHSAERVYGAYSDTALFGPGGLPWQRTADDIVVGASVTINRVIWWGAYLNDVLPATETMRIQLYSARPGDGLPGDVLAEREVSRYSRTETGLVIPVFPGPGGPMATEFRFETGPLVPISLEPARPYWLEIVQVGDVSTQFIWRGANSGESGRAIMNTTSLASNWAFNEGFDMAFQLSTVPEPSTLALVIFGLGFVGMRPQGRAGGNYIN